MIYIPEHKQQQSTAVQVGLRAIVTLTSEAIAANLLAAAAPTCLAAATAAAQTALAAAADQLPRQPPGVATASLLRQTAERLATGHAQQVSLKLGVVLSSRALFESRCGGLPAAAYNRGLSKVSRGDAPLHCRRLPTRSTGIVFEETSEVEELVDRRLWRRCGPAARPGHPLRRGALWQRWRGRSCRMLRPPPPPRSCWSAPSPRLSSACCHR